MPSIIFIVVIVSAVVYLLCDALQRWAAVQELARIAFAASMLALLLTLK
jgi:hypothetical protein